MHDGLEKEVRWNRRGLSLSRGAGVGSIALLVAVALCLECLAGVDVAWKTCAEISIPTKRANVCFVKALDKNDTRWEIELCSGLFLELTAPMLGGAGASTGLCATVTIPLSEAKDKNEALKKAEKELNRQLNDKDVLERLSRAVGKRLVAFAPFVVVEDSDATSYLLAAKTSWKTVG